MKKVAKTTRPFRYGLNNISYDYAVEMTNKLKGLDLIERDPVELCAEIQDFPDGSHGKSICLQCGRPGFDPWVRKTPWRRK